LPEIAVWNKNNSEPATPPRSRDSAEICGSYNRAGTESGPNGSLSKWENDMPATPQRRNTELADLGDGLDRSDLWLFGPLIAIVVAMPIAIIALTSVGLWFAAHHTDLSVVQRPRADTFASRWVEPPKPEVFLR
jgi:hypothetical protein